MANLPSIVREEIIDDVEELFLMGIRKPHQVWKLLQKKGVQIEAKTVRRYIDIVRRRIRNRFRKGDLDKILRTDLADLTYMEQKLWINYQASEPGPERSACILALIKIKERRAKLLGMDTENIRPGPAKSLEDLIKEAEENEQIEQQKADRIPAMDSGQAGKASEIPPQQNPELAERAGDGPGPDTQSKTEGG